MTAGQLSTAFFLQLCIILICCRLVGRLARRFGQPQVVGEMIAGVLLGPSLFGLFFPELQSTLFPKETLSVLYVGAQLGVGLYMFIVGLEFDVDDFRQRSGAAFGVSMAGMLVPFVVGAALAPALISAGGLFTPDVNRLEASLFLGAAIAITAFPMLARIIHERGLSGTPLGSLTLAAGAIGDAGAWCVLAVVLASFGGDQSIATKAIVGGLLFAALMIFLAPKLLRPLVARAESHESLTLQSLSLVLILFFACVWITDAIGIHTVFGGFLLGAVMPRGKLTRELRRTLEPLTVVMLLPMFFTYSGLNTRLDTVNSLMVLGIALIVLLASTFAKGFACWAAARLSGADQRTALAIGSLMNARGLMELIIINIGLQHAIIQPALFSILVLMAVVTTLMATPAFEWFYGRHHRQAGTPATGTSASAITLAAERSGSAR